MFTLFVTGVLANSEDLDEMPHLAAFHQSLHRLLVLIVCFDSLRPSQQYFSYDGTGRPGLNKC